VAEPSVFSVPGGTDLTEGEAEQQISVAAYSRPRCAPSCGSTGSRVWSGRATLTRLQLSSRSRIQKTATPDWRGHRVRL